MASAARGTVVVGVGGGIAAYKVGDLVRRLREQDCFVRVVMTPMAARFVSPLTFQALSGAPVLTDLADPAQESAYGHLSLARTAAVMVVAPATADLLARLALGLADDALTTTALACRCPLLVCPAMNTAMWDSPPVRANLARLRTDPRVTLLGPATGMLADGDAGVGRLAEMADIVRGVLALMGARDLEGLSVLVTAGPTREPLDPVRFLSNPSSGKMGYALAAAAQRRGARVTLVSGPVSLPPPPGVEVVRVETAEQMKAAALGALPGCRVVLACAAVSDFRPAQAIDHKQKKEQLVGGELLQLVRTPDVLLALSEAAVPPRPLLIGFAAETENLIPSAREKLRRKRLDLVVANAVTGPGTAFGADDSEVVLVSAAGEQGLERQSKTAVANQILDWVAAHAVESAPPVV